MRTRLLPPVADLSVSAATAGFVAVLVGFTSSIAIVFQAATALGASPAQTASWMWALGLGMGLCTLVPSLWLRQPVMVAWSTPGAAVLATAGAAGHFGMAEATGAFMVCAALIVLFGVTGWFERLLGRIPMPIASALLAGVLTRFGLDAFLALKSAFGLVALMLGAYLVGRRLWPRFSVPGVLVAYLTGRRLWPRYAVPGVLACGIAVALGQGRIQPSAVEWGWTVPVATWPTFGWRATVGLALPLFVVTMASQNLPGVAAIRAAGYPMPVSRLISLTGLATLVLAPFGGFALNLSAITAAICMGPGAHPDPARRYIAAVACGGLYCLIGVFGAAVTGLLTALPRELVVALAGFALLGSIGGGLALALNDEAHREAALITFLVTLSGVSLGGIGSAFWGVVAGVAALFVQQWRPRRAAARP